MTLPQVLEDRRIREFCPVHYPERGSCWDGCLPERVELARLAANLRQYWYVRRRGVPWRVFRGRMTVAA